MSPSREGSRLGGRLRPVMVLLAGALCAWAGTAPPARAHAVLLDTAPADGAALAAPPDAIVLRFNEPVRPISVRLLDGSGRTIVTSDRVEAADGVLRIALPDPLPDGRYVVSYRVTSADAHPVSGAFLFSVGKPSAGGEPIETGDGAMESAWRLAAVADRALLFGALLFAAGGAIFLLAMGGLAESRATGGIVRGLRIAAGLGIATAGLAIGLEGGLLAAAPPGAIFGPAPWRLGMATSVGTSAAVIVAGLVLLMIGMRVRPRPMAWTAVAVGALMSIAGLLLTGHAAATGPRWLAVPAWALHTLAVAFWVGSLRPLLVVLREPPSAAVPVVRLFSRLAVPAVTLLLAAGLAIAAIQVGSPAALVATAYGRLLLLKLAGVALLLLIAARNKWRLTPALAAGNRTAVIRLRRAIRIEIGVAAAILAATAVLAQTPPPDAAHAAGPASHGSRRHGETEGYAATATADGMTARLEVAPAIAGRNRVTIALTTAEGDPLTPLELSVAFSQPAAGIAPIERKPVAVGPGRYRLTGFAFLLPGRWTVRIDALITDFEKAVLTTEVRIRHPAD